MIERELADGEATREMLWVIDRMDELALVDGGPDLVDAAELTCRNVDALAYSFRVQTLLADYAIGRRYDGGGTRVALLGSQILPMAREQRDVIVSALNAEQLAELERRLAAGR